MKESLITFETAKLAKEKGFDIPVTQHWSESPVVSHMMLASPGDQFGTPYEPVNYNKEDWAFKKYSAPTQSQLQTWLRDDEKIMVWAEPSGKDNHDCVLWTYKVIDWSKNSNVINDITYSDSFEKALEQGLVIALNLI